MGMKIGLLIGFALGVLVVLIWGALAASSNADDAAESGR